ncbi:hypothetical protein Golob_008782, partial [Gossypium lobatum]|nr:hypothetical protein [Gossypium lobatum]
DHTTTKWAELSEGITLARSFNFNKVIFESDCASLVNSFRRHHEDITVLRHRIKETRGMIKLFVKADVK